MVPLREARRRHARDAALQLRGQESYAPTQISHSVSARRIPPALYLNLRRDKWLRSVDTFFTNTTEGLIVIAFKLCQEGNREPLNPAYRVQRIVRIGRPRI